MIRLPNSDVRCTQPFGVSSAQSCIINPQLLYPHPPDRELFNCSLLDFISSSLPSSIRNPSATPLPLSRSRYAWCNVLPPRKNVAKAGFIDTYRSIISIVTPLATFYAPEGTFRAQEQRYHLPYRMSTTAAKYRRTLFGTLSMNSTPDFLLLFGVSASYTLPVHFESSKLSTYSQPVIDLSGRLIVKLFTHVHPFLDQHRYIVHQDRLLIQAAFVIVVASSHLSSSRASAHDRHNLPPFHHFITVVIIWRCSLTSAVATLRTHIVRLGVGHKYFVCNWRCAIVGG
ncbi:hypothetical protein BDQ12DRAFT_70896 [Crucibulum laeve]|uniref:Uncharacterized protein n=1 Tax=Crucibulum laeve TaxID=68775 RepID=A0A5C3M1Q4_9AGAR|nr:hypothetical protein BDQ12DRAFT_70896 [Crucibulum laeve]